MKKVKQLITNVDLWKIMLMIGFLVIMLMAGGYTVSTKWGTIFREDCEKRITKKMNKIKTQTNYSKDMKINITSELSQLYETKLRKYCKDNNIPVTQKQINRNVRYYRLITIAMNDACEDITIDRYIHNNDLYRYSNQNDWNVFKQNVVDIYVREGKEVFINYYDNDNVIIPGHIWMDIAGRELVFIIKKNTDKLLEDLKIESCIFHVQHNGE